MLFVLMFGKYGVVIIECALYTTYSIVLVVYCAKIVKNIIPPNKFLSEDHAVSNRFKNKICLG